MNLVLFMTYGNSLKIWEKSGILERELELYKEYAARGHTITFVSYGDTRDVEISKRFPFISIIVNRWHLPKPAYYLVLRLFYPRWFERADVFKTNQLYGAHVGLRLGKVFQKPVVVRQGYSHVDHKISETRKYSLGGWLAKKYERRNLLKADAAIFSTKEILTSTLTRLPKLDALTAVVPNYVQPNLWSPGHHSEEFMGKAKIVFFGRFVKQKNLATLIDASVGLPIELFLIGDGPLLKELRQRSRDKAVICTFPGRLAQKEIVAILRRSTAFVLPSHYEGHPKALIEAMAFGIPVVAANSPGIRELVNHRVDGILAEPTEEGLRNGMKEMLEISGRCRSQIGGKARENILTKYSVKMITKIETEIIESINHT